MHQLSNIIQPSGVDIIYWLIVRHGGILSLAVYVALMRWSPLPRFGGSRNLSPVTGIQEGGQYYPPSYTHTHTHPAAI